jgi:NAD(P)-dependent dehydrogenase (short-subunit alcohol dehydrogenase family)
VTAAAPSRSVNLGSASHWTGEMHWADLQFTDGYDHLAAYDESKLAMTLLIFELARRLEGSGVTAGATTSEYLAAATDVESLTGVHYEGGRETMPLEASRDREAQACLWRVLEGLVVAD